VTDVGTKAGLSTLVIILLATAAPTDTSNLVGGKADDVTIEFLEVGQGDAAIITTAEERHVLIDAGPSADGVASLLRRRGIDTLDLVVASHNHADHIGGMAAVLRSVFVRAYLDNGVPTTTATYARTLRALEDRGTRYLKASPRRITVGSVVLRVLPMPPRRREYDQNDQSVGLMLEYGLFRALFAGDGEQLQREYWRSGNQLRAHVLKVSHHGAANGTDASWLESVQPSLAVISVGARNSYGHPARRTVELLRARGIRTLRTDQEGLITVIGHPSGSFELGSLHSDESLYHPAFKREANGKQELAGQR
jgi:beta-lactamase superfamily II metal-dependent hydrolase